MAKSEDKGFALDACDNYSLDNVPPVSSEYNPEKAGFRRPTLGRHRFVIDGKASRFLEMEPCNWKGVSYTLNQIQVQLVFEDGSQLRDWIPMPTWDPRINALLPWDPQQENRWGQFMTSLGYDMSKTLWPPGFKVAHLDGKSGECDVVYAMDRDGKVKRLDDGTEAVQVKLFGYFRPGEQPKPQAPASSGPTQSPRTTAGPSATAGTATAPGVSQAPTQRKFPNL